MGEIRKILFIRTDRIGDVLMNLPAIRLLRQAYPKAYLEVLLEESLRGLLTDHPDIDELGFVNAAQIKKGLRFFWQLVQKIRRSHFQMVIVSNPDKQLHQMAFLARIPIRVGYNRKWGFLLTHRLEDRKFTLAKHEIDANLDLVRLVCDRAWDGRCSLPVQESAERRVGAFLAMNGPQNVVAVHPGTSNPRKRWPLERFAELCRMIRTQTDCGVILVGGAEETALSQAILEKAGVPLVDGVGQLALQELVALLRHERVKALVSCDSGPVPIAWMNGTPVVALYAQNDPGSNPARWGPRDGKSQVIFKPMEEITASEVFAALQKVLGAS